MKLEGNVDVTHINVNPKSGYKEINIACRNMLLKNMSNPSKFGGLKKHGKIK